LRHAARPFRGGRGCASPMRGDLVKFCV
jgi:hypothetical protein